MINDTPNTPEAGPSPHEDFGLTIGQRMALEALGAAKSYPTGPEAVAFFAQLGLAVHSRQRRRKMEPVVTVLDAPVGVVLLDDMAHPVPAASIDLTPLLPWITNLAAARKRIAAAAHTPHTKGK